MSKSKTTDLLTDAWGFECAEMVRCDTCNGSGQEYGETCIRCGGRGEYCERDESNDWH